MTKKRRCLIAACVLAACVGVVWAVLALLPPQPGVTKVNFDRIEDGMSISEVEQILGGPGVAFHGFANRPPATFVWTGDGESLAFVEFTDNSVRGKTWRPSTETIFEKVRRWLHLPK